MRGRISVFRVFSTLVVLGTTGACIPDAHVDRGTGGSGGPISCGGASGAQPLATWANVRDIIDGTSPPPMGCYGTDCHTPGDRKPQLLDLNAAPRSDADLYNELTTFKADRCGNRVLVKPCAPDESAFYLAQAHLCGTDLPQMPFGCLPEFDNCTPADKLEGVRQWIANGAPRP